MGKLFPVKISIIEAEGFKSSRKHHKKSFVHSPFHELMCGRMSWGAHIQLSHCFLGCLVHGRPPDSSLFVPESDHCPVPRSWLHSDLVSSSPPPNIILASAVGGGVIS